MFKLKGPFCQSCGLPFSPIKNDHGKEKDQENSPWYCSRCYENGEFIEPNISLQEMLLKVRDKLKEKKIPAFIAVVILRSIPKLKRWKQ